MLNFAAHRQALFAQLPPNSLAIIPSASLQTRNNDAEFPFRQDSDFYYLTGFTEDSACLVLRKADGDDTSIMFCQPKIKEMEIWTGYRLGPEAAAEQLNISEARSIEEFTESLPKLLENIDHLYAAWGKDAQQDALYLDAINKAKLQSRKGVKAPQHMHAIEPLLHEQRLIKSEPEIEIMRRAAQISAEAHIKAMEAVKPGIHEYQLEGLIRFHASQNGSRFDAYTSIVGSGANACVLHYIDNDDVIENGNLVLIDAGCEVEHYASDITRTFPANGRFSQAQKALYEVVLDAQLKAIDAVKPGNHCKVSHEVALQALTEGLVKLGLLSGDVDTLIKEEAYKPFFMHGTGHWLGLDVHDVGAYKVDNQWRELKPGMVVTIEPGLYVAPDNMDVDEKWRGIGIRIEDDVLVTDQGHEVLSHAVPKSVEEIEALASKNQ
ncbi:Xaa-Pro aminopeptidase [Bermanella marisrubri]|uniref:Xaa-Pro aminopeptidase n=1 Tax=Bermanella marisrubri TaxID=207949 RepID=Q1MZK0_9GAMM|nr:Xaa-Pro aminopeptidase [Bermanella marisrubri]EAT11411.1 aminopeptidase P [Oceanobacter sp. RED65] [Bermanella marisrubri]QIZ85591.1 Xaa-Pro aminopeptidase [Bermanella marisrubri]